KGLLSRLKNDWSICLLDRLFCLELCRFCFRAGRTRHVVMRDSAWQLLIRPSPVEIGYGKHGDRALRLYFLPGGVLVWVVIDHIRGNSLAAIALQRFSFIDAAEIFIFISGYVSGLVYTIAYMRSGFWGCCTKAARRCLQLYVA